MSLFACLLALPPPFVCASELPFRYLEIAGSAVMLAAGDVDGDGDPDLLLGYAEGNPVELLEVRVRIAFNDGQGRFELAPGRGLAVGAARSLLLADADQDGDLDLIVGAQRQRNRLYRNHGDGNLEEEFQTIGLQEDDTLSIAHADLDGDGRMDLIAGNRGHSKVYLGRPQAAPGSGRSINREPSIARALAVGDFDADGVLDLISCNAGPGPTLHRGLGRGAFASKGETIAATTPQDCRCLTAADIDGDGDLDLLADEIYRNEGGGRFTQLQSKLRGSECRIAGDLDGDGRVDLVDLGWGAPMKAALNDGDGGFSAYIELPAPLSIQALLVDVDGDADLDLIGISYENTYATPTTVYLLLNQAR